MYHGYGPKLWKQSELYNSFWNGSDKDFIDTVTKFYNGKYSERSKAHQQFWNNYMKNDSFNINHYTQPIDTNKPPYKNKTLQDYMTIQTHKQGGNMKIKSNNQTTLIPRHQTGGLASNIAEKFRKAKYAIKSNAAEKFRQVKVGRFQGDSPESAILLPEIIITPQATNSTKPASGTRSRRSNAKTTITSTITPTSTENTGTYIIQRGDTLGAIANNLGMSVDELARLNNINNPNRIYAGRTLITKAPTVETPDIKVETPSIPDYGYGITDSNLKLGTDQQYYPSYNQDELLRSAFSKFGLNFDDYKQLTADKLPTNVAPVSQEVKTFNPGNTIQTPSYRALRNARLEDEVLKRSKLLPFAKQGTKLIRRK